MAKNTTPGDIDLFYRKNVAPMRIYLHLTPNTQIVPFNYQQSLVGAFHRWLGKNELHDDISLSFLL